MADLKWYVIRAVSGQEKKIKTYLENEIARQKLEEYIPEVLIPSEKVYEMRQGKKRVRERNFFPGYVIVQADISHGEVKHVITGIPGIIGFLGSGTGASNRIPVPLRESEINRILGRVGEVDIQDEEADNSFIKGESVKVMDGPFSGFTGTIEEIHEERKKINVTVKIFGRNTPVELNFMQVEKVD